MLEHVHAVESFRILPRKKEWSAQDAHYHLGVHECTGILWGEATIRFRTCDHKKPQLLRNIDRKYEVLEIYVGKKEMCLLFQLEYLMRPSVLLDCSLLAMDTVLKQMM